MECRIICTAVQIAHRSTETCVMDVNTQELRKSITDLIVRETRWCVLGEYHVCGLMCADRNHTPCLIDM